MYPYFIFGSPHLQKVVPITSVLLADILFMAKLKTGPTSSSSTLDMLPIGSQALNLRSSGANKVLVRYGEQGVLSTNL